MIKPDNISTEEEYIAIYALKHLINLKKDGLILVNGPYEGKEQSEDLAKKPLALMLKSPIKRFAGFDMASIKIESIKAKNIIFDHCDFLKTQIRFSNIEDMSFVSNRLSKVTFSHCIVNNTSFDDCLLNNSKFKSCSMDGVNFSSSNIKRSFFWDCPKFEGVDFSGCDLEDSYFINVKLINCTFERANMTSVTFNHVELDDKTTKSLDSAENKESIIFTDEIIYISGIIPGEIKTFPSVATRKMLEQLNDNDR